MAQGMGSRRWEVNSSPDSLISMTAIVRLNNYTGWVAATLVLKFNYAAIYLCKVSVELSEVSMGPLSSQAPLPLRVKFKFSVVG